MGPYIPEKYFYVRVGWGTQILRKKKGRAKGVVNTREYPSDFGKSKNSLS
jgi:hypothetical protein